MTLRVSGKNLDTYICTRSESILAARNSEPASGHVIFASLDKAAGNIKKSPQRLKWRQRDRDCCVSFPFELQGEEPKLESIVKLNPTLSPLAAKPNEQPRRPMAPPGSDHGAP